MNVLTQLIFTLTSNIGMFQWLQYVVTLNKYKTSKECVNEYKQIVT